MGTKYIIEVEDKPFELLSENGFTSEKLFRVKGFNSLVFDWNGLNKLTPYTEPDIEQVRKEAYQKGYETGYEDGYNEPGKNQQEAYQRGLSDAWEAARKILRADGFTCLKLFGDDDPTRVIKNFTASEAIEKIRQYEQRQEEQIQIGDEVERILNGEVDSKAVFLEDNEGYYHCLFWTGCCFTTLSYPKEQFRKTGRTFPEIATILENMREGQNG